VAGFTSSGGPSYTYVAPPLVVTGVSPTSGPTVGGTPVTISGTGFSTAPDGSSFAFGADPATDVVCQSATSCTADTPAEGAGAAVISATVAGQVFADGPHFTYKLTPTVSWATPPPITYGTRLGPNQLHATSPSAGTFTYNPPAATVLGAGTHTLSATFTPTDTATYATVTDRVTLTVDRAPPAVTWAMPAPVAYGSVLGSTQLDAGASVPGSFVYTPPAGTRLSPGAHTLSATFTPTDTADYAAETVTSTQSVTPAPTTTALTVLSPITFGNEAVEVFSVTVTTASGVTPTGTATVTATATTNAATKVCTIVLRAGAGHCSPTSTQLAIGAYQVTVAYTPSADFVASAFPGARVIVSPPGTGLARWGAYSSPTALPYEADTPTLILGGVSHATTIAAGNSSDMALDGAGTVWVWGDGIGGELGQGNTTNHPASAVKVPLPWPATAIGEADNTDVAISATGSVMGWGANASGQLCLGNQTQQHSPVPIPSLSNVVAAAGGGTHMLYLLSDGSLEACGTNHYGELGDGTVTSASTPVAVVGLPDSPVVAISAASSTSAALLANGQVWMWGSGAFGQLGDGSTRKSDVPVEVQLPSAAVEISCGGDLLGIGQSLALLANGQVYGWGNDQYGQLGNGAAVNTVELPEPITGAGHVVFTQVVSGGESGYGVSASGEVWAWGSNAEGQIGNAQSNGIVLNPEMIWNNVASVSATAHDVVVLRKSKT
jgi:alpha-tubulin suppressor-like RCC1 family protein